MYLPHRVRGKLHVLKVENHGGARQGADETGAGPGGTLEAYGKVLSIDAFMKEDFSRYALLHPPPPLRVWWYRRPQCFHIRYRFLGRFMNSSCAIVVSRGILKLCNHMGMMSGSPFVSTYRPSAMRRVFFCCEINSVTLRAVTFPAFFVTQVGCGKVCVLMSCMVLVVV